MTLNINQNTNKTQNATSFKGGAAKLYTIKNEKVQKYIEKAGNFSTPANRFLIGATALSIQPWMDFNNKDVDEETRKMSALRTVAKIVVGTTTGILTRIGCIRLMKNFTRTMEEFEKTGKKATKWDTFLIPTNIPYEKFSGAERLLKKHRNALGSFIAIAVMLLTDAPLTKLLTNFINGKRKEIELKKTAQKEVNND